LFLNLGGGEVFLVVVIILLFFGSDKLPGIAKGLGKGLRELNDAKTQIQEEITRETGGIAEEIRKHTSEIQAEIGKAGESVQKHLSDADTTIREEGKIIGDTLKD
jgi:sec-independent protein translocase protein TatA